jgi:MFS family permease
MTDATHEAGASPGVSRRGHRATLGVVFATILIDFIGFSVLIPVLPLYAGRFGASSFQVGLLLSVFALAQLLFLPAWGALSDRIGRRPVILVSLLGTSASFLMLVEAESLAAIYAARAIGGFFAGSIGAAQAVVTDVTPPAERARGMGLLGAAFGLGFVVGNALGGLLAGMHVHAPFYAITALSLLSFIVACVMLPESLPAHARRSPAWSSLARSLIPAPLRLVAAVHDRRIAFFLYIFFHTFTAFAALESMLALFAKERFGLEAREVGLVFAYLGLFIALTQGVLVGRLAAVISETRLVVLGLVTTGAGLIAVTLLPSPGWLYLAGPLISIGSGVAFPAFTSLYSKACHAEKAGELLGESQSMATAGRILGPLWAGLMFDVVSPDAPFVVAGVLVMMAAVLVRLGKNLLVGPRG